jgi:anaerobic ribonucleoside-triphosphate reductase activating protein
MNYAQIRKYDVANGIGVRTTLFVSGCHFKCYGCFNEEYQDFAYGQQFTDETLRTILMYVSEPMVSGFSLLGGEPFDQPSEEIYHLLHTVKQETGKSIWVWSGNTFDVLLQNHRNILECIDVLIDGQFQMRNRDLRLRWRGSSNQRVIDVQKSLRAGEVVLHESMRG